MTADYGAFLELHGRRCVVVGGGAVAERKVGTLVECGASVSVIAPRVSAGIRSISAAGRCIVRERPYRAGDLAGAFLAFAATDDRALNARVVADARQVGALVNAVDDPGAGDFIVPATVRRGEIAVAVATGGRSPAFSRALREELGAWLTPGRVELLDLVADVRRQLQLAGCNPGAEAWRWAVDQEVVRAIERGDRGAARTRLLETLAAPSATGGR